MSKRVLLLIRDGWGYRTGTAENALATVPTPHTDKIMATSPHTLVGACGESVGLPPGYQGNSEVGHMTIGSGRIIFQSLMRINKTITDGSFFSIPAFVDVIDHCKAQGTVLHIIGLLQTEGVHAHRDHLFALLDLCAKKDFKDIAIHLITDGRDSPVTASLKHIAALKEKMSDLGIGYIATVLGRYYAMDRDERWDRTKKTYDCFAHAETVRKFEEAEDYVRACHENDENDEFILPGCHKNYKGIAEHDGIIFTNFRTDRTRQLTKALIEDTFDGWERKPLKVKFVAMTKFYTPMNATPAFSDQNLDNLLGQVVADNNKTQLRISETEKYAHITFFFNGQLEAPFKNEERVLIPSPRVATYDLNPEMSVYEITENLTTELAKEHYDLVVTNLVNCDMVGHTGMPEAIHKAVAAVDECVGTIVDAATAHGYDTIIFADHGNAEDQSADWRTSHTLNPVPCIIVSNENITIREGGGLQDIAPTALDILGLDKPAEMTGKSLIVT